MKQNAKNTLEAFGLWGCFFLFSSWVLLPIYYLLWQYVFTDYYGRVCLVAFAIIAPIIVPLISKKKAG